LGTVWKDHGGSTGQWKIKNDRGGPIIYQLYDSKGNPFIFLVKADNNILFFADNKGNPLRGNEDFSYTLNRVK
jgi:hypothetical protein